MSTSKKILVAAEQAGERLDIFLSSKLKISRSQIQKMIDLDLVSIDGKSPKKAGDKLNEGSEITVITKSVPKKSTTEKNKESFAILDNIKIICETPDYIVIEKPSGVLTHSTMAKEKNTLTEFLIKKFPELKKVGDDPIRPGIVHRLDKEASGLLVVARTQGMFEHLKKQFKERTINKEYLVLAHGRIARDWGEINFPIRRSKNADRMAAVPIEEAEAKEARTEFWIEKRFVNFTLLRVKIHTGRMHQIRAHLFAYNNPVVGDQLYFQKKQKRDLDKKLGRLFLHSTKLEFSDLENTKQNFESPLPIELVNFLKEEIK